MDESGFRLGDTPRYGWAPKGQHAPGQHVQGKWKHLTMIGAVALDGLRGFMTVDSGTSRDVFEAFVGQQLVPNLKVGDIVVMDNLSAHKGAKVKAMIEEVGALHTTLFTGVQSDRALVGQTQGHHPKTRHTNPRCLRQGRGRRP